VGGRAGPRPLGADAPSPIPEVLTLTEKNNPRTHQTDNPNTILKLKLDPKQAGLRHIDLAHLKDLDPNAPEVKLEQDVVYQWSVALVPEDKPSQLVFDQALIKRVKLTEENLTSFKDYNEHGIWYDALGAISVMIESHPNDSDLRLQRAELLEEASSKQSQHPKADPKGPSGAGDPLKVVAEIDRQSASHQASTR